MPLRRPSVASNDSAQNYKPDVCELPPAGSFQKDCCNVVSSCTGTALPFPFGDLRPVGGLHFPTIFNIGALPGQATSATSGKSDPVPPRSRRSAPRTRPLSGPAWALTGRTQLGLFLTSPTCARRTSPLLQLLRLRHLSQALQRHRTDSNSGVC